MHTKWKRVREKENVVSGCAYFALNHSILLMRHFWKCPPTFGALSKRLTPLSNPIVFVFMEHEHLKRICFACLTAEGT